LNNNSNNNNSDNSLLEGTTLLTENISKAAAPPPPAENIKFLYDSEDLMETMINIKNPNMKSDYPLRSITLLKLNIKPYDYNYVLRKFSELSYSYGQMSIDDIHVNSNNAIPLISGGGGGMSGKDASSNPSSASIPTAFKYLATRHEEGEYIIQHGNMQDALSYLRRGCPPTLRFKLWRLACGLQPEKPSIIEEQMYQRLRGECDRLDLITDELFMYDIQTILDDPRFFVFEEELKEIIFCFSRDASVRDLVLYDIHSPWLKQMGIEFSLDTSAPPSAILPYLGFATYFAPVGYLSRNKIMLYSLCKYLFCLLWCKLNVFSSDNDSLIQICKTFEYLLWTAHPKLFLHLVSINLHPIKIAFPWIQLGFVGLLEVDQILHLWERLIGFMDPTLLAVTAVAIFMHRSEMLLRVSDFSSLNFFSLQFSYLVYERSRCDNDIVRRIATAYYFSDTGISVARRAESGLKHTSTTTFRESPRFFTEKYIPLFLK
jgi:hypothetical protein